MRLVFVRWPHRFATGHGAEAAGAGADVPQNHEGGGAVLPAFTHVGAAGALANGVQVQGAHGALEFLIAFTAKEFDAQPLRPRVGVWRGWRRNGVGDDVEGRRHEPAILRGKAPGDKCGPSLGSGRVSDYATYQELAKPRSHSWTLLMELNQTRVELF